MRQTIANIGRRMGKQIITKIATEFLDEVDRIFGIEEMTRDEELVDYLERKYMRNNCRCGCGCRRYDDYPRFY